MSKDRPNRWGHVQVVIPALNEAESIGFVLRDLPAVGRVIVVDNGSSDETALRAREAGATVVEELERGYGAACLRGLRFIEDAIQRGDSPPEIVAFCDADYSDHVDQLGRLIDPIDCDEADLVLGSRLSGQRELGAMPAQSIWGNRLACGLMRLFWGTNYTDLGPFRAIRYASLRQLGMTDRNFGWTVEMQIKAAKHRLRVVEIPVPYRCRVGVSKISGTVSGTVKAGSKILYLIFKYGFRAGLTSRVS